MSDLQSFEATVDQLCASVTDAHVKEVQALLSDQGVGAASLLTADGLFFVLRSFVSEAFQGKVTVPPAVVPGGTVAVSASPAILTSGRMEKIMQLLQKLSALLLVDPAQPFFTAGSTPSAKVQAHRNRLAALVVDHFIAASRPERYDMFHHLFASYPFVIEGDSLVLDAMSQINVHWSLMQPLHVVYLVEKLLADLLSRQAKFIVVWFQCHGEALWKDDPAKFLIREIVRRTLLLKSVQDGPPPAAQAPAPTAAAPPASDDNDDNESDVTTAAPVAASAIAVATARFRVLEYENWWTPAFSAFLKQQKPDFVFVTDAEQLLSSWQHRQLKMPSSLSVAASGGVSVPPTANMIADAGVLIEGGAGATGAPTHPSTKLLQRGQDAATMLKNFSFYCLSKQLHLAFGTRIVYKHNAMLVFVIRSVSTVFVPAGKLIPFVVADSQSLLESLLQAPAAASTLPNVDRLAFPDAEASAVVDACWDVLDLSDEHKKPLSARELVTAMTLMTLHKHANIKPTADPSADRNVISKEQFYGFAKLTLVTLIVQQSLPLANRAQVLAIGATGSTAVGASLLGLFDALETYLNLFATAAIPMLAALIPEVLPTFSEPFVDFFDGRLMAKIATLILSNTSVAQSKSTSGANLELWTLPISALLGKDNAEKFEFIWGFVASKIGASALFPDASTITLVATPAEVTAVQAGAKAIAAATTAVDVKATAAQNVVTSVYQLPTHKYVAASEHPLLDALALDGASVPGIAEAADPALNLEASDKKGLLEAFMNVNKGVEENQHIREYRKVPTGVVPPKRSDGGPAPVPNGITTSIMDIADVDQPNGYLAYQRRMDNLDNLSVRDRKMWMKLDQKFNMDLQQTALSLNVEAFMGAKDKLIVNSSSAASTGSAAAPQPHHHDPHGESGGPKGSAKEQELRKNNSVRLVDEAAIGLVRQFLNIQDSLIETEAELENNAAAIDRFVKSAEIEMVSKEKIEEIFLAYMPPASTFASSKATTPMAQAVARGEAATALAMKHWRALVAFNAGVNVLPHLLAPVPAQPHRFNVGIPAAFMTLEVNEPAFVIPAIPATRTKNQVVDVSFKPQMAKVKAYADMLEKAAAKAKADAAAAGKGKKGQLDDSSFIQAISCVDLQLLFYGFVERHLKQALLQRGIAMATKAFAEEISRARTRLVAPRLDHAVTIFCRVQQLLDFWASNQIRVTTAERVAWRRGIRSLALEEAFYVVLEREEVQQQGCSCGPYAKLENSQIAPIEHTSSEFQMNAMWHLLPRPKGQGGKDFRVPFTPDPWQKDLLDIVDSKRSAIVSIPTSGGKTFISFYCMKAVLKESHTDMVVYVCPTRSLLNQATGDVYARFSQKSYGNLAISVYGQLGGGDMVRTPFNCQILITVPEVLEMMLLSPVKEHQDLIKRIRYAIFDEIHCSESTLGGEIWDRLFALVPCPFVALSATLGSTVEVHAWLNRIQEKKQEVLPPAQRTRLEPGQLLVELLPKSHHRVGRWSDIEKHAFLPTKRIPFYGLGGEATTNATAVAAAMMERAAAAALAAGGVVGKGTVPTDIPVVDTSSTVAATSLLHIHPMTCLTTTMIETKFPEDCPFTPKEVRHLHGEMRSVLEEILIPDLEVLAAATPDLGATIAAIIAERRATIDRLNPEKFFAGCRQISQAHARELERNIKDELGLWGKLAVNHPNEKLRKVFHDSVLELVGGYRANVEEQEKIVIEEALKGAATITSGAASPALVSLSSTVLPHPDTLDFVRANILPLLTTLQKKGMLPTICFSLDESDCTSLVTCVIEEMERAEDAYRQSPHFKEYAARLAKKQEDYETRLKYKDSAKKAGKTKETDESGAVQIRDDHDSAGVEADEDYSVPEVLPEFSFAPRFSTVGKLELQELIDDLKRRGEDLLCRALQRGIGLHHGGIKGKVRKIMERLFRAKQLSVIFATDTLALGIHSPCRTVVFAGDSMLLNPSNYKQMSGRAGRRGLDFIGHAVFLGIPMKKIQRLVTSDLSSLQGHATMDSVTLMKISRLLLPSSCFFRKTSMGATVDIDEGKRQVMAVLRPLFVDPLFAQARKASLMVNGQFVSPVEATSPPNSTSVYRAVQLAVTRATLTLFYKQCLIPLVTPITGGHGALAMLTAAAAATAAVTSIAAGTASAASGSHQASHHAALPAQDMSVLGSVVTRICNSYRDTRIGNTAFVLSHLIATGALNEILDMYDASATDPSVNRNVLHQFKTLLNYLFCLDSVFGTPLEHSRVILRDPNVFEDGAFPNVSGTIPHDVVSSPLSLLLGRKFVTAMERYNQSVLTHVTYLLGQVVSKSFPEATSALPLTTHKPVVSAAAASADPVAQQLHATKIPVTLRSPFVALSGAGENYSSLDEFLRSTRDGLFLDASQFPMMDFKDSQRHDGGQLLINALLTDYHQTGNQFDAQHSAKRLYLQRFNGLNEQQFYYSITKVVDVMDNLHDALYPCGGPSSAQGAAAMSATGSGALMASNMWHANYVIFKRLVALIVESRFTDEKDYATIYASKVGAWEE